MRDDQFSALEEISLPKPCTSKQMKASSLSMLAGGLAATAHVVKNFGGSSFTYATSIASMVLSTFSLCAGSRVNAPQGNEPLLGDEDSKANNTEVGSWKKTATKVALSACIATAWAVRSNTGTSETRTVDAAMAAAAFTAASELVAPAVKAIARRFCCN
jgi:hypothetical protein